MRDEESITIDGKTYNFSDQTADFVRVASLLSHVRKMILERTNDITVLHLSRKLLKQELLDLIDEESATSEHVEVPESISFENAD